MKKLYILGLLSLSLLFTGWASPAKVDTAKSQNTDQKTLELKKAESDKQNATIQRRTDEVNKDNRDRSSRLQEDRRRFEKR